MLFCKIMSNKSKNKNVDINVLRTTRFWNTLNHVRSKSKYMKVK